MKLTGAFQPIPRVYPLADGSVTLEDFEIEWELGGPGGMFDRHLNENSFDVFEYGLSRYLGGVRRDGWRPIPVFLSWPMQLLANILVSDSSPLRSWSDLAGRRFGLSEFEMTAGLWLRIILKSLYGIQPSQLSWVSRSPARESGSGAMPGVMVNYLQPGQNFASLLRQGDIDAAFVENAPNALRDGGLRQLLAPSQLFGLFAEFKRKTGARPINHTVIVQQALLDEHPHLAGDLYRLFERAKFESYNRARRAADGYLLLPEDDFARQAGVYGDDPYPFGLEANGPTLDLLLATMVEEGMLAQRPDLRALFAEPDR